MDHNSIERIMKYILIISSMSTMLIVFIPITALAVGSYGANLASSAYQSNTNPFYASGYGGRASDGYDGECTWYAWGRAYEKTGVALPCRGNANDWTLEAAKAGYSTGTEAQANSIMVEHYSGTGHVFFVEKVENGYAYVSEGNWKGYYHEDSINLSTHRRTAWPTNPMGTIDYIYLNSHDPEIYFDGVDENNGRVHVVGWAYDPDDVARSIDVHVYLFQNGNPTCIGGTIANVSRVDVDNALHIGQFHGFDATFETSVRGAAEVQVAAINVGEGSNKWGDKKNITISEPNYTLDVNGWIENVENGGIGGYATFDMYVNGSRITDDVSDFCQGVRAGSSYEIKDIKVAGGKSFDGYSGYTRSGFTSGGRTGTVNSNTDVRLKLHTVDANAFLQNKEASEISVYNGHSYYYYTEPATWYEARIICEHLGGHLVTITSSGENSFVSDMTGNSDCWIGATDKDSEGTWKWITGEDFVYSNWAGSQPDNYCGDEGSENYVHFTGGSKEWNDNCGCSLHPFVCEIDRTFTISYDSNGGSHSPSSQNIAAGQQINLSNETPERTGYRFVGWGTDPSDTHASYNSGDAYSKDEDATLYAIWRREVNNVMVLPAYLTEIEEGAFTNTSADAVIVPENVSKIGDNAFDDIVIYGYAGSYAETYAEDNHLSFIPITEEWVLEPDVPEGATVTAEKWTYTLTTTETKTSSETSLSGWTQAGFEWKRTGGGTHIYANYPSGFDKGSNLYSAYEKNSISSSETSATKREVSGASLKDYIYWHWCWIDNVAESNRNVLINDYRGEDNGKNYIYFDAFETTASLSTEGMTTNGPRSFDGLFSTYHHPEYNLPEYASWWWYRLEVYQQTYTDYQKVFTYVKKNESLEESAVSPKESDEISNVQHLVKYKF